MVFFVLLGLAVAFLKEFLAMVLTIGLIVFLIMIIIRLLADLFWWGRDRGKW